MAPRNNSRLPGRRNKFVKCEMTEGGRSEGMVMVMVGGWRLEEQVCWRPSQIKPHQDSYVAVAQWVRLERYIRLSRLSDVGVLVAIPNQASSGQLCGCSA
eukprot:scaffold1680_cov139-Skeletonema_menzelii.AAC.16